MSAFVRQVIVMQIGCARSAAASAALLRAQPVGHVSARSPRSLSSGHADTAMRWTETQALPE